MSASYGGLNDGIIVTGEILDEMQENGDVFIDMPEGIEIEATIESEEPEVEVEPETEEVLLQKLLRSRKEAQEKYVEDRMKELEETGSRVEFLEMQIKLLEGAMNAGKNEQNLLLNKVAHTCSKYGSTHSKSTKAQLRYAFAVHASESDAKQYEEFSKELSTLKSFLRQKEENAEMTEKFVNEMDLNT